MRNWVAVLLGDRVEATVVNTETKVTGLAFDKEDRGCGGRGRWTDESFAKVLIEVCCERLVFILGKTVERAKRRRHPFLEVDGSHMGDVGGGCRRQWGKRQYGPKGGTCRAGKWNQVGEVQLADRRCRQREERMRLRRCKRGNRRGGS